MSNDAPTGPGTPGDEGAGERLAGRLAHQWLRRAEPRPQVAIEAGPSNFSRAQVPWGLDLAAAWAWRLIVIGIATYALFRGVEYFAELTIPVIVALLITALGSPVVSSMERIGVRRGFGAGIVVLGLLALVATMLALAGQQVASGANDLATPGLRRSGRDQGLAPHRAVPPQRQADQRLHPEGAGLPRGARPRAARS